MAEKKAEGVEQADNNDVLLTIFTKSFMPGGSCYFGIDDMGLIKRPIYRQELSWERNQELIVDRRYQFRLTLENIRPELPHNTETVTVEQTSTLLKEQHFDLYDALCPLATDIDDIFGNKMINKKYVEPGTDCPSVDVISANRENLHFYVKVYEETMRTQNRVQIFINEQTYDFPYTGYALPHLRKADCLVVLCLGNPWIRFADDPEKCYILVARVVQKAKKNKNKKKSHEPTH